MAKYDFGGYATRNDLLCGDGRTIRKDAFKDNDGCTVPLVWNHDHNDPENVLGHALLENRSDGVYAYATFNDTDAGQAAKKLVQHGDVKSLSIYANRLKQVGGDVVHGTIRELSLVLAGANPGAFIDCVMSHSDSDEAEAVIVGFDENITIYHSDEFDGDVIAHADDSENPNKKKDSKNKGDGKMNKNEKMNENDDKTVAEVFDELTEDQKTVVYALIGQALAENGDEDDDEEGEGESMKHNFFDNDFEEANVLTH